MPVTRWTPGYRVRFEGANKPAKSISVADASIASDFYLTAAGGSDSDGTRVHLSLADVPGFMVTMHEGEISFHPTSCNLSRLRLHSIRRVMVVHKCSNT